MSSDTNKPTGEKVDIVPTGGDKTPAEQVLPQQEDYFFVFKTEKPYAQMSRAELEFYMRLEG